MGCPCSENEQNRAKNWPDAEWLHGAAWSALAAQRSGTEFGRQWTDWRADDGGADELLPALIQETRRSEFAIARSRLAITLRAAIRTMFN